MSVTCGVPQGSVLGPVLWNLIYDGILNIDMPEGVETIAFADDLTVVTTAKTEEQLMRNTNKELHKIAASKKQTLNCWRKNRSSHALREEKI
jgi:hypothetical protein